MAMAADTIIAKEIEHARPSKTDLENHVHFSEDTDEVGHTQINIKRKSSHNFEAHVGFLQIHHRYQIFVNLPLEKLKGSYKLSSSKVSSICIKIINIKEDGNELQISSEFLAYKEKLLKESIFLDGPDDEQITLTFFARVLGKGKGTPMLREGVTCIGVESVEDEDEGSDWQGFE